jgi:hypothetical protein
MSADFSSLYFAGCVNKNTICSRVFPVTLHAQVEHAHLKKKIYLLDFNFTKKPVNLHAAS